MDLPASSVCPSGYRSIELLIVSLSWALGEGHREFDVFMGLTKGLASVGVSGKCHWDHTTPQRALCYSGAGVTRGCWQREQPRAPGGLCFSLPAACAVCPVLFWPWINLCNSTDSVENKWLINVTS